MFDAIRFWFLCACAVSLIGCATSVPTKTRVIRSDDGLSEIAVPDSWHTRPNLGRNADIRIADAVRDNYLLVTTYRPEDIKPMSFEQFADTLSGSIRDGGENGKMSAPRRLVIAGRPAIEYEINTAAGDTRLVYLSTVVDGVHARYHLVGWALAGARLDEMRRVMTSFRESDQKRAAASRVDLIFKWPAPMTSKASFSNKSSKRGQTFEVQGEATSSVKPIDADHLLISTRVISQKLNTASKPADKDKDAYLQDVLKAAMTNVPDYVVNSDGAFVRIDNLAGYHKRIQDALVKGLPKGESEAHVKAQQMVQAMLTEQTLAAAMQEEWNNVVEYWAGGSYAVGENYEFVLSYQAPALDNQSFPMVVTQQLAGHVPCHSAATGKSCVRLLQTSRVSGPEYTQAMNKYVRKTVGGEVTVDSMEVVKTVEVITDPMTMLPYRTIKKEVKRITVSAEGKAQTNEDVDESSATYRY